MELFDVHAHLNFPDFSSDWKKAFERASLEGVSVVNVGTDLLTSREAVRQAQEIELEQGKGKLLATVGIHPTDWRGEFKVSDFNKLAETPEVVAIGECGLDYFRERDNESKQGQAVLFRQQIEVALKLGLPLMIHCRHAYKEIISILNDYSTGGIKGNVHFFAGDIATARSFIDRGFTISFTAVITFARDYDDVIKYIPLESILTETDCPFIAPLGHRGKRNEPVFVRTVAEKIAEIKDLPLSVVAEKTVDNARRLFGLETRS
jgi:TatD DNase family protein